MIFFDVDVFALVFCVDVGFFDVDDFCVNGGKGGHVGGALCADVVVVGFGFVDVVFLEVVVAFFVLVLV